jgi:plasmid stabilization system protein ParE
VAPPLLGRESNTAPHKKATSAADKLEEDIYAACELLSKNPHVGHKRPDLTDEPVRFWPIRGQYLVIYLPDTEPLKIVRILHGAQDASSQLH